MTPETTSRRATILVVDDAAENLSVIHSLLKDVYRVRLANSGQKALDVVMRDPSPDLILLDIMMPEMDGYQVCRHLKRDTRTRDIPVIFLTAMAREEDEEAGFEVGAVDYITKPISPVILQHRVYTHVSLKQAADQLKDKNASLNERVRERTEELERLQDVTILAMASLAETRDNETGNHIRRTQNYVLLLGKQASLRPQFEPVFTPEVLDLLYKSAPLHDIGKVGIPDAILLKPGKLNREEFEVMKLHTVHGRNAIAAAETRLGGSNSFLRYAREIAHYHHEKWDGTGYPEGLRGESIPVHARLMALADVYDALISRRVYKVPMSHEAAVEIIVQGRGTHFDPTLVDIFMEVEQEFRLIAQRYAD